MKLLAAAAFAAASAVTADVIDVELSASAENFELSSSASLNCNFKFNVEELVEGAPESPQFELTWIKNNNPLISFSSIENYAPIPHHGSEMVGSENLSASLNQTSSSSSLSISSVSLADEGEFSCQVRFLHSQKLVESPDVALYFSKQASHTAKVFRAPEVSSVLSTVSFDTRENRIAGNVESAKYNIASCSARNAYPAPESVSLRIGNRIIQKSSEEFTPVQDGNTNLFNLAELIFEENLLGENDDNADVACSFSHPYWPEEVVSNSTKIEVLWLPVEASVSFANAANNENVEYALEGSEITVLCDAPANPEVSKSLHEGEYIAPIVVVDEPIVATENATNLVIDQAVIEEVSLPEATASVENTEDNHERRRRQMEEVEAEEAEEEVAEQQDEEYLYEEFNSILVDEVTVVNNSTKIEEVLVDVRTTFTAQRDFAHSYQCRAYTKEFESFSLLSELTTLPVYYLDAPVFSGPSGKHSSGASLTYSCKSNANVGDHAITYSLLKDDEVLAMTNGEYTFNAEKTSAGLYSCQASVEGLEGIQTKYSAEDSKLDLVIAEKCQYESDSVIVKSTPDSEGNVITTLVCPIEADSSCKVRWFFDRSQVGKYEGQDKVSLKVGDIFCL